MSLENWIATITLGLTIINVIIAGIIVPIYLNRKIVQTQKQIIQFQDEVTRKSQLARLKIDYPEDINANGFVIQNTGLVSARNIRIAIYFDYSLSEPDVRSYTVEDFDFASLNNAISFRSEIAPQLTDRNLYTKSKGFVFTIDTLPPSVETGFLFGINNNAQKQVQLIQEEVKVQIPAQLRDIDFHLFKDDLEVALKTHYKYYFFTGQFRGDISCENCGEIIGEIRFEVPTIDSIQVDIQEYVKDELTVSVTAQFLVPSSFIAQDGVKSPMFKKPSKKRLYLGVAHEENWKTLGRFHVLPEISFDFKAMKQSSDKDKILVSRLRFDKWLRKWARQLFRDLP